MTGRMGTILEIQDLNLSFNSTGREDESLYIFHDLNAQIPSGKITALVGGNGVGKTTLFNVISGIRNSKSGHILYKGQDISITAPHKLAGMGIGRLFQGAQVYEELSILDNMMMGAATGYTELPFYNILFRKRVEQHNRMLEEKAMTIWDEIFGKDNIFARKKHEVASQLSFGQQRLLAISSLLMRDHELLLLDEPTSGVHTRYIAQIAESLVYLKKDRTILLIEHNMAFVRKVAEHCMFMADGKILIEGTPDEVLDNDMVHSIYLGF